MAKTTPKTLMVGLVVAVFVGCVVYVYPAWTHPGRLLSFVGGQEVFCTDPLVDVGAVGPAERVAVSNIDFINIGWRENCLLGRSLSCDCIETGAFPICITPGTRANLDIAFTAPDRIGAFKYFVTVYTSDAESQALRIEIVGTVIEGLRNF